MTWKPRGAGDHPPRKTVDPFFDVSKVDGVVRRKISRIVDLVSWQMFITNLPKLCNDLIDQKTTDYPIHAAGVVRVNDKPWRIVIEELKE